MSGFAVMRHPETGGLGTVPSAAVESHLANGWVRVSDYRPAPADFNVPDFADAPDVDAPDPEPEPDEAPAKTTEEK